ncbi:MAG: TIGR00645 family protein [Geminicoccaceae bacterium]
MERTLERLIFASRWLMAPFYLGLIVALALMMARFVVELVHIAPVVIDMAEQDVLLAVLSLVDLTLAGSLVLMVIFSGYENFVSKINTPNENERLAWMGTLDFSGLKLKLIASVVAISGIDLLKEFMNAQHTDTTILFWKLAIHMGFVVSGVLLALMDFLAEKARKAKYGE